MIYYILGQNKSCLDLDVEIDRDTFQIVVKVEKEEDEHNLPSATLALYWPTFTLIYHNGLVE